MDERKDQKIPKETTFKNWKVKIPWLKILSIGQQKKMICEIYTDHEEKLKQMPHQFDVCKGKHTLLNVGTCRTQYRQS